MLLWGHRFSEKLPTIPLFGPTLIHQLRLLGSQQHPQRGVLFIFNLGTENILAEGGGVIKVCNIFGGKKLANTCCYVGGRIIVQQEKISTAELSWTKPLNALQQAIRCCFIKFCIYCFFLRYEFFVHCALRVENKIFNMVLMSDIWNFTFFGREDVSPTHSKFRCFVSGS